MPYLHLALRGVDCNGEDEESNGGNEADEQLSSHINWAKKKKGKKGKKVQKALKNGKFDEKVKKKVEKEKEKEKEVVFRQSMR